MPAGRRTDPLVYIGVLKLLKSAATFALAFGLFHLLHGDLEANLTYLVEHLHVDPHAHLAQKLIEKIAGIAPDRLRLIGYFTILYGIIFGIEGAGLVARKVWAEWFTLVGSSLLLPLEIYELFHHATVLRALTLIVNTAIVCYLALRLRKQRHPEPSTETPAAAGQLSG